MAENIHKLKDERGIVYDVPESELRHAQSSMGLTPATDEDIARHQRSRKFSGVGEKLKATGVALARVPTLGFSDYLVEGVAPGYLKEVEEQLPALTAGVEVGGTIGAALLSGGGSLLAKGALKGAAHGAARGGLMRQAFRGADRLGDAAAGFAKTKGWGERGQGLARHMAREAAEGTAFGLMQGNKQAATDGDYERAASTVLSNIGIGLGTGGALGIAGIGARAVGRPLKKASAEAFAKVKGFAPGPTKAFGDMASPGGMFEPLFKYAERGTGKDVSAARTMASSSEMLDVALRRAAEESDELGEVLVRHIDEGLDDLRHVDKLTRTMGGPGEIGKPLVIKELLADLDLAGAKADADMAAVLAGSRYATKSELKELNDLVNGKHALLGKADEALSATTLEDALSDFGRFEIQKGEKVFKPNRYARGAFGGKFWKTIGNAVVAASAPGAVGNAVKQGYGQYSARAIILDRLKKSATASPVGKNMERYMAGGGKEADIVRSLDAKLYQPVRRLLEEEGWGKFGQWQKLNNEAWVKRLGVPEFGRFTVARGKDPDTNYWAQLRRAKAGQIESLVKSIGGGLGDDGSATIREMVQGWKQSAEAVQFLRKDPRTAKAVPQKTFESADRLGKAADRILKSLDEQDGKSLYSKIYATRQFEELLKNQKRFLGGMPGQLAIGLGIATGSPVVYGALRTMQAIGDVAMSPVKAVDTLGSAYLAAQRLQSSDKRFVKKMFSKAKRVAGTAAKGGRAVGRGVDITAKYSLVNLTAAQLLYEKNVGELNEDLADLDAADEETHDSINALGVVGSDLKALAIAKKRVIREYLGSLISTPSGNPTLLGRIRPPSKVEAQRFNQVKFILENPGEAAKLLSKGELTADQAKAIRTVWPSIFEDLQMTAVDEMAKLSEQGKTISYQKRLQIGLLLGLPTDPTLNYKLVRDLQNQYQQKVPTPQPPQQRRAPKLNRAMMSESEKTEEGVK